MNSNNFGILRGRLVADVRVFPNKDGSSKVKFTIAAENDYKDKKTGKREAQMIPVEGFVSKAYADSPFAKIHKGDKVTLETTLKNNDYKDAKTNEMVYSTVIFINKVTFEESKSVTEARAAENAVKAAEAAVAEAPAVQE